MSFLVSFTGSCQQPKQNDSGGPQMDTSPATPPPTLTPSSQFVFCFWIMLSRGVAPHEHAEVTTWLLMTYTSRAFKK